MFAFTLMQNLSEYKRTFTRLETNRSSDFAQEENYLAVRDNFFRRDLYPVKWIHETTEAKRELSPYGFCTPYHVTPRYYLAKVDKP